ncbi:MAG: translocation/assembly module TamB domain-containing protein [Hyphomicrobiales bacterium]
MISLGLILNDPCFQTFLARTVASYFAKELGAYVDIKALRITPHPGVDIRGLDVRDQKGEHIFYFDKLKVNLKDYDLDKNYFKLKSVDIDSAIINLFWYKDSADLNLQFIVNHFSSGDTSSVDTTSNKPLFIDFDNVNISRTHFHLWNENDPKPDTVKGMHYSDINVKDINIRIPHGSIEADTINASIDHLSCYDTCGFQLDHLSGDFRVSSKFLLGDSVIIKNSGADLDLDLQFLYDSWPAYTEFLDDIYIKGNIRTSVLNLDQIGYFADIMFDMTDSLVMAGIVDGSVSNFRAKNFTCLFGNSTYFRGDVRMNGLPDFFETFINLRIDEFHTNKEDVEFFALPIEGRYLSLPDQLSAFGDIGIKGYFTGFYNDFVAQGDFNTGLGDVYTDIILKTLQPNDSITYQGYVKASNFELGRLLNLEKVIGSLNLDAHIKGTGLTDQTANVLLDGEVNDFRFSGQNFNNIKVKGDLTGEKFNGIVGIDDSNLKLDFDGKIDFGEEKPVFDFMADIKDANLYALGLLKADTVSSLSTKLNISFKGVQIDDIEGKVTIDSTVYYQGSGKYVLDHFALVTLNDTSTYKKISLNSDVANGEISGDFKFEQLMPSLKNLVNQSIMIFDDVPVAEIESVQDLEVELNLADTRNLTKLFMPELSLSDSIHFSGNYNSKKGIGSALMLADTINYNGVKFKGVRLNAFSYQNQTDIITRIDRIAFQDPNNIDTLAIGVDSLFLQFKAEKDSLLFATTWTDTSLVDRKSSNITGVLNYSPTDTSEVKILSSNVFIREKDWKFFDNNSIEWKGSDINFKNIGLYSGEQLFSLNGRYSNRVEDTLAFDFKKWDISNFDPITLLYGVNLDGHLDGHIGVFKRNKNDEFVGDLAIDTLLFNGQKLGKFELSSSFNSIENAVDLSAQIINEGNIGNAKIFGLEGKYKSDSKNSLDFDIDLVNMNLVVVNPFLEGIASEIEGLATGKVKLFGSFSKPDLRGGVSVSRTQFRVDYLNVPYSLSGNLQLLPGKVDFNNLILYDSLSNQAQLSGAIMHRYLNDFVFDVRMDFDDMSVFNTTFSQNQLFYGQARATGNMIVKGPLDNIRLDINATSNRGTDVVIPLNTAADVSENRNIVFINSSDTTDVKRTNTVDLTGFNINVNLNVTPDASVLIYLPLNTGNIRATGRGDINLGISSNGEFTIVGDYTIQSGEFAFRLENIISRKFKILEGGRISWAGSPYDANVNIKALYEVKASLAGLGIDLDNNTLGRRILVDCYLGLKNDLFDPDLNFGIKLPNLDERTQQAVFSVIDTTNQTIMQQQMFSLLLLSSFSYSNSVAGLGSSSLNLISNQLSNWLSQLSKDFDVGINYRPGDDLTSEEVEVALSTQLFDERVIINSNFGVIGNPTTQNTSNIVGDVDVEVKLTKDGRFRVRAFNRSNDNTIYSLSPYDGVAQNTQGIGLFYTQEFNHFKDLFKKKKKKKKKKDSQMNNDALKPEEE